MDWLKQLLSKNPIGAMLLPSLLSSVTFLGHLIAALSDGVIDSNEFHQLMASASGIEVVILFVIMWALNKNKKD